MEILKENEIRIRPDEKINELIKLIAPEHKGDKVKFFEGPLWQATKPSVYRGNVVWRFYHLINHHFYCVREVNGIKAKRTYLRVSGRGNINEITKEEALEVVGLRRGYVEDWDVMHSEAGPDPAIPYNTVNCDW